MTQERLAHEHIEQLLGAYALHAVDAEEAQAVREHLADCPRCRHELTRFEQAAAALGNSAADAPGQVWDHIAAQLCEPPPALGLERRSARRRLRWVRRSLPLLALAAAVAIAFLAFDVSQLNTKLGRVQTAASSPSISRIAAAAANQPHSRRVELRSKSGTVTAEVVVQAGGQAFLVRTTLPRLPSGQTYQLWGLSRNHPVSLALVGRAPSGSAFRVDPAVTELMITAEPTGGVVVPTAPVLLSGSLGAT